MADPMSKAERAEEFREMARMAAPGNPGLAAQCMMMARQIENEPTSLADVFASIIKEVNRP